MWRMQCFWWTHQYEICCNGRHLPSNICLSVQISSVFSFLHIKIRVGKLLKTVPAFKQHGLKCQNTPVKLAQRLERVGNFCFETASFAISCNFCISRFPGLLSAMNQWRDSSSSYYKYCLAENIPQTCLVFVWHT